MRDLVGTRCGKLFVIAKAARSSEQTYYAVRWLVRCDCGVEKEMFATALNGGRVVSCGCIRREKARENIKKARGKGRGNLRHGFTGTPEWNVWCEVRRRCTNRNSSSFPNYGGRGIVVCERWKSFENFFSDMGKRPSPEHQIERSDNDGNYEPSNCRWATRTEQARNRRSTRLIVAFGEALPLAAWSERTGIGRSTIAMRILRGMNPEQALTK